VHADAIPASADLEVGVVAGDVLLDQRAVALLRECAIGARARFIDDGGMIRFLHHDA
jgi:hypothetical protein